MNQGYGCSGKDGCQSSKLELLKSCLSVTVSFVCGVKKGRKGPAPCGTGCSNMILRQFLHAIIHSLSNARVTSLQEDWSRC